MNFLDVAEDTHISLDACTDKECHYCWTELTGCKDQE